MIHYLFVPIIFLLACSQQAVPAKTWKSETVTLSFEYDSTWTLLPNLDTKEKVLSGVINVQDGSCYIIQITPDIPKERLSNDQYYASIKKTNLEPNPKNRFLGEKETVFHGENYHEMSFMMYDDRKWGLRKEITYVRRTGEKCISVQILFPCKEKNVLNETIPTTLINFDQKVSFN